MILKSGYTREEIYQIEKYVFRLHEYICTQDFALVNWHEKVREQFYADLLYAKHFAEITRKIFLDETNDVYVAVQVDRCRAETDGCIRAYKIPTKDLLFYIFPDLNQTNFKMACMYRKGTHQAHEGYSFCKLDKYLKNCDNPLITDPKPVIDFIALEYEKENAT